MSDPNPRVNEDDLQAYVDNRLEADRRQTVEEHLATHPEEARRIGAYRAQSDAIRQGFAGDPAEPLPARLTLAGILEERRRPSRRWLIAASIVLALGVGLGGGVLIRDWNAPTRTQLAMRLLEQEALSSHVVYAPDRRHPIEVTSAELPHLAQWLSNRLSRTIVPPDLSPACYQLMGGRLLATERGSPAALLMYENAQGDRLSVLLRPMAKDLHAPVVNSGKTPVGVQAWIANGLGIAVAASVPEQDLARVSADIERELGAHG